MKVINRRSLMKLTKKELIDRLEAAMGDRDMMEMDLNMERNNLEQERTDNDRLKNRIRFLSTCFETLDQKGKVGQIKTFVTEEREITAEAFGKYIALATMDEELINMKKDELISDIAKALVNEGIVQFIVKRPEMIEGPTNMIGTVAAKLFVVPWEKMAYRTVRLKWWRIQR